MPKKYRSRAGIIYDVLMIVLAEGPLPPTRIATYANLPYDRLRVIIDSLEEKGLIERTEKGYVVTEEGRRALKVLEESVILLKSLGFRL